MSRPLDYLRSSPVRGQLEPYDSKTPPGWRYIQTTDTINELKVLLPPGTAAMYEQLLKLENHELSKKSISWDRILEIRHLKDRMIRKCQKLSKIAITPASSPAVSPFRTIIAPDDFRVKEMEKWFREQQKRTQAAFARRVSAPPMTRTPMDPQSQNNAQCTHSNAPVNKSATITASSRAAIQRSITAAPNSSTKPSMYSRTQAIINLSRAFKPTRTASLPAQQAPSQASAVPASSTRPSVVSPPPLPVLIRGQRQEFGLDDELGQPESMQGDPERADSTLDDPPPYTTPKDGSSNTDGAPITSAPAKSPSPQNSSSDEATGTPAQPYRKRSCIKRGSMSELVKTVSWADDQEWDSQLSKYTSAAHDAQASGRRWEEIREIYLDQIDGLEQLQAQVQEGLESLRTESDHLKRLDETIHRQREQLRQTFDEFERKQTLFTEKVKEALEEADDVMTRHGLNKTTNMITNE